MLKEFKDFVMRGNVIDLAVAVIIGAAFGKIVTSFTNDIIMPPIGMLLGNVNFTDLFIALDGNQYASLAIAQAAGAPTINYGVFINTIIDFIIVAFVIFLIVKQMKRMKAGSRTSCPNHQGMPVSALPKSLSQPHAVQTAHPKYSETGN